MTEFTSIRSYMRFANSICSDRRFVRTEEQEAFLSAVRETVRRDTLRAGFPLYRAQVGCDWPTAKEEELGDCGPRPYGPRRMMPYSDKAAEGRVNPVGIPCLYAATNWKTAVAEVRPWIGSYVSVATLEVKRQIVIANCTTDDLKFYVYFAEPDAEERAKESWREIDRAFARPVDRSDHFADYAPTQVLAETFRSMGLDGVAYRSSLGEGHNVALFDLGATELTSCFVTTVRGMKLDLDHPSDGYSVSKKLKDQAKTKARRKKRHA